MKDITPGTLAISKKPKAGKEVTSNEFLFEFDVEVDSDGCYVVEFRLLEDDPVSDDEVLSNSDAFKTAYCLKAGARQKFRVTTSKPGPAGSTPPPAAAPGTISLPPVDGTWPADDGFLDSDIELKYEIVVYFIGPCNAAGGCNVVKADDLPAPYMTLDGPNTGTPDFKVKPIDRALAALAAGGGDRQLAAALASRRGDLFLGERLGVRAALASRVDELFTTRAAPARRPEVVATVSRAAAGSEEPLVVSNKFVEFTLRHARSADTFGEDAVEVTRFLLGDGRRQFAAQFFVRDVFPALKDLGRALLQIEDALAAGEPKRAVVPVTGIVRHGRMTLADGEGFLTGYFFEDRFNGVWSPGRILLSPPPVIFLAGNAQAAPAAAARAPSEVSETAWMTDEWYVYPFAWLLVGSDYADNIAELISDTIDPVLARNDCIKEFEILSHGGKIANPGGTVVGSLIQMGSDSLRSDDFDASGNPLPTATTTIQLLDKLKQVMCPDGKLIFSACNQKVGDLLKNMSKYIDKGVTVIGNSNTGIPEIEGDMRFKDGVAVP